ncbi:MAG TPA: hypothetical protein VGE64_12900 [Xanthomonadaceae bacterium]
MDREPGHDCTNNFSHPSRHEGHASMLRCGMICRGAGGSLSSAGLGWRGGIAPWQDVAKVACPCDVIGAFSL